MARGSAANTMRMKRMPGRTRRGFGRVGGPLLLLLALTALDWGAFGSFGLFGVRPEALLVLVCVAALHSGTWPGALIGAAIGLLSDLGGGHLVGLSAFGYAAAAAVAGSFSARLFSDRFVIVWAAVGLGTVVEQVVYVVGAHAFGYSLAIVPLVTRVLPLLVVYHGLLTPLLYPLGRRFMHALAADTAEAQ